MLKERLRRRKKKSFSGKKERKLRLKEELTVTIMNAFVKER